MSKPNYGFSLDEYNPFVNDYQFCFILYCNKLNILLPEKVICNLRERTKHIKENTFASTLHSSVIYITITIDS